MARSNFFQIVTVVAGGAFTAAHRIGFGFNATEIRLEKTAGAGEVFVSFDGSDDDGRLAGAAPVELPFERTRSRSAVWLRSAAGTETVHIRVWS